MIAMRRTEDAAGFMELIYGTSMRTRWLLLSPT